MEMMWGKDRRGLESALHIAQQLVVKRSFPRLLANRNHLPHRQLVHSDLTFSTGSCRGGGGGDYKQCRYRKWKRVSKMKWKREVKNSTIYGDWNAGLMQAGREGKWSGRGKGEGREGKGGRKGDSTSEILEIQKI